jgi:hypothetical protein
MQLRVLIRQSSYAIETCRHRTYSSFRHSPSDCCTKEALQHEGGSSTQAGNGANRTLLIAHWCKLDCPSSLTIACCLPLQVCHFRPQLVHAVQTASWRSQQNLPQHQQQPQQLQRLQPQQRQSPRLQPVRHAALQLAGVAASLVLCSSANAAIGDVFATKCAGEMLHS